MTYAMTEGRLDEPADEKVVEGLSSRLGIDLPADYLDFLRQHNGGEGFLGDNYIVFWRGEELADFNDEYEVEKYAPGILLFGSDGGGEGFGFDTKAAAMPIVRLPFIGMDRRHVTFIAADIPELFNKLADNL